MEKSKITVRNLNLHYGENHALKNINMDIRTCDYSVYRSQRLRKVYLFKMP